LGVYQRSQQCSETAEDVYGGGLGRSEGETRQMSGQVLMLGGGL